MKMMLAGLCVCLSLGGMSQEFGGNPPSVKWQQVNTPPARVIFPVGLDTIAREVAAIIARINNINFNPLGSRQAKVNVVLQNQSTVANGYVALGPFRSEFYLTPNQNSFSLGSLPWHKQLAAHEYRHVQQNINFNVGISHLMRILFGQQAQALANSMVIPDWFSEGDAVLMETAVSQQGRGRLPYFYNSYRSLWREGKNYSWMKLRNGSYRDYTPDHYETGYLLVAYGHTKYGNDFWRKVTHDAAAYRGLFYPFQQAIRRYAGIPYRQFRNDALSYFKTQLPQKATEKPPARHFIANEEFPAYLNDSALIFLQTTYKAIPAFTIRNGSTQSRLRVRNVSLDNQFSYRNGKIVYASFRPDPRWGWKNFGELQVFDVATGSHRRLTRRSKYFSPDISPDGSTVVAVEADEYGRSKLQLIDGGNGMLIKTLPNPDTLYYTYPKFYNLAQVLSPVRNRAGQMSLALIDVGSGVTDYLLPFSSNVLGFPVILNDTAYFSASFNRQDVLLAYALRSRTLLKLETPASMAGSGFYQPAINANTIAWTAFTAEGLLLRELPRSQASWTLLDTTTFVTATDDFGVDLAATYRDLLRSTPTPAYDVKGYPKSVGLLNFHSLIPLVNDPDYSLTWLSENILNTLQSEVSFLFNRNEQFKRISATATYGAWYPQVSAGTNFTIDRRGLYRGRRIYWNEWEARGGVSLPLNFSKGRRYTNLTLASEYVYNRTYFTGLFKDSFNARSFSYINTDLVFSSQIQRARQHIYPRFAQTLRLNYKRAVTQLEGNQFLASGNLYFPGVARTHNLVLNAAYQQHDTLNQLRFSNSLPFSRGYTAENLYRMVKVGANYHFPLVYPDVGLANIVYLLRVRANLFYDQTFVPDFVFNTRRISQDFRSTGTEIFFDTRWWNQLLVSFGFRYSFLLDDDVFGGAGTNRFEFILPVNLIR